MIGNGSAGDFLIDPAALMMMNIGLRDGRPI